MSFILSAPKILGTDSKAAVIENGFIEIEDARIKRVGMVASLSDTERAGMRHYDGCTILPGLINAHEHLATKTRITPGIFGDITTEPIQLQMLRAAKNAKALLLEGITTIRECGAREHLNLFISKGVQKGFIEGPDIVACGQPISITGGHCHYYSWQINSPYEGVRAVRTELMAGADFIKVHATGGAGTLEGDPKLAELTLEELKAIVEDSHRAGKRVASHAIGRPGIENSLRAGVDTLEHGHYLDEALLDLMARNGTFFVPTLSGYVPLAEHGLKMGRPAWMVEKARRLVDAHRQAMAKTRAYKEIVIAAGTDSSGELVEELELLISCGYPVEDAIKFATINAAKTLGIEASTGTLEEGKDANVLVVKGDPLADIRNLRLVADVIKRGKIVVH
jgi:imidazolonepropionase-like amidohydrolase